MPRQPFPVHNTRNGTCSARRMHTRSHAVPRSPLSRPTPGPSHSKTPGQDRDPPHAAGKGGLSPPESRVTGSPILRYGSVSISASLENCNMVLLGTRGAHL